MVARHEADRQTPHDELRKFMRESRMYREGLEKALGKVIVDQRAEVTKLRTELDELRAEIRREPVDIPALKLIGGRRG